MNAQEVLHLLLADGGEEWFLTITPSGRAEITTSVPKDVSVIGKIECTQANKNSNDDSTITNLEKLEEPRSLECELPV